MNTSAEKTILKVHGIAQVQKILKSRPRDANFIAIDSVRCNSIFYKLNTDGKLYADFDCNGQWSRVKHKSIEQLTSDLACLSYLLCRIDLLESEIYIQSYETLHEKRRIEALRQLVSSQIDLVKEKDECDYWRGQGDAFEIVTKLINEVTATAQ